MTGFIYFYTGTASVLPVRVNPNPDKRPLTKLTEIKKTGTKMLFEKRTEALCRLSDGCDEETFTSVKTFKLHMITSHLQHNCLLAAFWKQPHL